MQTPVYAGYEAIEDDVHAVRKRETSRLWYRDRVVASAPAAPARLAQSFLQGSTFARASLGADRSAASRGGVR